MLEVAQECASGSPTIQVTGVDVFGRVTGSFRGSGPENQAFSACYQKRLAERTRGAPLLAPGRIVERPANASRASVPIRLVADKITLRVTLNDSQQATLLLDTGASKTVLNPALIERLGISLSPNATRWPATLVGGTTITMPFVRIRSLRVGGFAVEDIDVGVFDTFPDAQDVHGLLGADFLNQFKVTLDRRARRLTLEAF